MLNKNALLGLIVILLGAGLLGGCGGDKPVQNTTTVTMGQELMDLEESYKQGILTEREYKRAKEAILERYE